MQTTQALWKPMSDEAFIAYMRQIRLEKNEKNRTRSFTEKAFKRLAEEMHSGKTRTEEDVYSTLLKILVGSEFTRFLAQKIAEFVVKNWDQIWSYTKQGVSAILNVMGRLLKAVPWWELAAATMGGIVVGVFVFQAATWLGATYETAKNAALIAGGGAAGAIAMMMLGG